MTAFQSIILGIVQGLTEYIPVSSKTHLIIVPSLLGWHFPKDVNFVFNVLVQLGTLVGVFIYFANDIRLIVSSVLRCLWQKKPLEEPNARLGWLIVLATLPACFFGLLLKDWVEELLTSVKVGYTFLLLTTFLLVLAEQLDKKKRPNFLVKDALIMGFAQVLALFPGISRSGSTISAGIIGGLSRESAARFSFLMSIPVLLGASIVASKELFASPQLLSSLSTPLLAGFLTAAISGYIVIRWFLKYLKTRTLYPFALYCLALSLYGLLFA